MRALHTPTELAVTLNTKAGMTRHAVLPLARALIAAACMAACFATHAQGQAQEPANDRSPQSGQEEAKAIPLAQARLEQLATDGVAFRRIDGVSISSANSALQVAADEGLWRSSKGLPQGAKILMSVSAPKAPADGQTALKLRVKVFDAEGKELSRLDGAPIKVRLETSLGRIQVPGVPAAPGLFTRGCQKVRIQRVVQGSQASAFVSWLHFLRNAPSDNNPQIFPVLSSLPDW